MDSTYSLGPRSGSLWRPVASDYTDLAPLQEIFGSLNPSKGQGAKSSTGSWIWQEGGRSEQEGGRTKQDADGWTKDWMDEKREDQRKEEELDR